MKQETWISERLNSIGTYAFAEVDRRVEELKAQGITPIDFGVGDPTVPTPEVVRRAAKEGIENRKASGYPSYIGDAAYRSAVARWMHSRFSVSVDPETEISSTIGSKEAVFHFHEGVVNQGDYVVCPTPGYPPYTRGTLFAEGTAFQIPLRRSNGYLMDFSEIPDQVARKAKILWLNYPNSPSGAVAPESFYLDALHFAEKHGIIVASDEAYSEIYFTDSPPISILNITKTGVIVFNSLSKRSAMTGYRIGWVAGDKNLISIFQKVKTNIDSGTATFIQDGAIAALSDEVHVRQFRRDYLEKRDILCDALSSCGLEDCRPDATLYVWQKVPERMTSLEFAAHLLDRDLAIVTTPGEWISEKTDSGENPGEGYVRFALVPSKEKTIEAAKKLAHLKL